VTVPSNLEGYNIKALLENPSAKWEKPAITTFHWNNHSLRTKRWRYIRYADGGEELYDHNIDDYEWKNLAKEPAYTALKEELAKSFPKVNKPELPRKKE